MAGSDFLASMRCSVKVSREVHHSFLDYDTSLFVVEEFAGLPRTCPLLNPGNRFSDAS